MHELSVTESVLEIASKHAILSGASRVTQINLVIGQLTPPVGVLLFVAGSVSRTKLSDIIREMKPFYVALIGALALVTYVPALSLWLPNALK